MSRDLFAELLDEEFGPKPSQRLQASPPLPEKSREIGSTDPTAPTWGGRVLARIEGGAVSLPDEGVTRQGQNPDPHPSSLSPPALDDELERVLAHSCLPSAPRLDLETCACGAERHPRERFCDLCRRTRGEPSAVEKAVRRWKDLGTPSISSYVRQFGCPCACHKGPEIEAYGRRALATGTGDVPDLVKTLHLPSELEAAVAGLAIQEAVPKLVRSCRYTTCFCPGAPLSVSFQPESPRAFEDERLALEAAAEGDTRRRDAISCAQLRTRQALSGISSRPVPGVQERKTALPGLLPPMGPVRPPEGPALTGPTTWCGCGCHEEAEPCACACHVPECCLVDDARKPHEERGLAFAGCTCREHDATKCGWRKSWKKQKACACAKPGPGTRRPKQKPHTAEQKARRTCAALEPPPQAIPPTCTCACHVGGCCTERDGSRNPHDGSSMFGACPCAEHDPAACSLKRLGPRILAEKIDTLHVSYHLQFSDELRATLKEKLIEAREGPREYVTIKLPGSEVVWRVHGTGAGRFFSFRLSNEYADLLISNIRHARAAQLRFELRAAFLWERELEGAWGWADEIATGVNVSPVQPKAVLTRIDLCVDTRGVDFARAVRDDFVMRARRRTRHNGRSSAGDTCTGCAGTGVCKSCQGTGVLSDESPPEDEVSLDEHASGLRVSGFSFGHAGIVSRVYDKTREIREKSKDKKWLYLVWATRGWVATEPVWRVEVQIRRETLTELVGKTDAQDLKDSKAPLAQKLRGTALAKPTVCAVDGVRELMSDRARGQLALDTLDGCRDAIAAIWGYAVGGTKGHTAWFKWTTPNPEDGRRSRWDARPEWKIIQRADWGRMEAFELVREHHRDARFNVLLPQFVGLTRALAAVAGRVTTQAGQAIGEDGSVVNVTGEREPTATDFEGHAERYVLKNWTREGEGFGEAWWRNVNLSRIERGLEGYLLETDEEWRKRQKAKTERKREKKAKQLALVSS